MNKLFTFGCSYTEGYDDYNPLYVQYKEYRGGLYPKSWPELLSEKFDFELKNYGLRSSGNQQIFTTFCNKCNEIKKSDIVIIEWSFVERYRLSDSVGSTWLHFGPGESDVIDELIGKESHERVLVNRTLQPYYDEIYDFEKIIDRLAESIGFQVYYWTIINELIYNLPKEVLNQKKYLINDKIVDEYDNTFTIVLKNGGLRIVEETNEKIKDWHMGEKGHQVQAKLFYDHIMSYKTNSL